MCGIAGYISMGDKRPNKANLEAMFLAIQVRGKDASGFAAFDDKFVHIAKAPIEADNFLNSKPWKKLKELPAIMLLHTRAATQGATSDNNNNHPLTYKNIVAIHNGVIHNEEEFDVPKDKVDSMAILKSWHQHKGDITKVFGSLQGSFAVGLIDTKQAGKLTLFRHTSPIEVLLDKTDEILYFASTTFAVKKMIEPHLKKIKGFVVSDRYSELEFADDSCWEITTTDGLVNFTDKLTVKPYTYVTKRTYDYNNNSISQYNRSRSFGYWGEEDEYDIYDRHNQKILPFKTDTSTPPTATPPETKETIISPMFLEHVEPKTQTEYDIVNEKLATSSLKAIECPNCKNPTLIHSANTNPKCNICTLNIYQEGQSVN